MKASDWLPTLPRTAGVERENAIIHAVEQGWHITPTWCPIRSDARGHHAILYVSADALQIGEPGDSVRVSVTAIGAQRIADMLLSCLETSRIHDLSWEQADTRIEPDTTPGKLPPGDPRMKDTEFMADYSREVDAHIAGRGGLIRDAGKSWIIHSRMARNPHQAVNYGFCTSKPPGRPPFGPYRSWSGLVMWQTVGTQHNAYGEQAGDGHTDYSQNLVLVLNRCLVDGMERDVTDVMQDANLSWLVSDDGKLTKVRYGVA